MPTYYGICPQCERGKAVEVELTTEHNGMAGYWSQSFTSARSARVPEWDECSCVLTPDDERVVIAQAEDDAINDPHEPVRG